LEDTSTFSRELVLLEQANSAGQLLEIGVALYVNSREGDNIQCKPNLGLNLRQNAFYSVSDTLFQ